MSTLWMDLRYAARGLARSPAFALTALITLALGIGANTAIFSVINALLLRPLPFQDADRLALVWESNLQRGWNELPTSFPNFEDWKRSGSAFENLAFYYSYGQTAFNLTGAGGRPERVQAAFVSSNLFATLGVEGIRGRAFRAEEDQLGAPRVAMISDPLWRSRFAADPRIIGGSIVLDGAAFTVVGVAPPEFRFPRFPKDAQVWLPFGLDAPPGRRFARGVRYLTAIGRLKRGVTLDQARAEMSAVAKRLEREHPDINRGSGIRIVPFSEHAARSLKPALAVLAGAVALVLLIACANVANLLLARATARRREIAIRLALGAGRLRLLRQFVTEGLLMAVLGGTAGAALAALMLRLFAVIPYNEPTLFSPYTVPPDQIGIDGRVLGFALAVALVTGVVFGAVPALQGWTAGRGLRIKDAGRARKSLVVAETALAVMLLIGAGLAIRSFANLRGVHPGFEPESVVTFEIGLARTKYAEPAQVAGFYERLLEKLCVAPGVSAAGVTQYLPLGGADESTGVFFPGDAPGRTPRRPQIHPRSVSEDYFHAIGLRLVRGRVFTADDARSGRRVTVMNEAAARRLWSGEDPIGKRVALDVEAFRFDRVKGPQFFINENLREVVGVVGDVKHQGLEADAPPEMYIPFAHRPGRDASVVLRAESGAWPTLARNIRDALTALDPEQPLANLRTMSELMSDAVARPRFNTLLLATFGGLALALAAAGVYGVLSYVVAQRTREIGIRMAVGAEPRDVVRLVVRQAAVLAAAGSVLGLAGAFALTRLMRDLLFGVGTADAAAFIAAPAVLAAVALAASLLPARRAGRVDPAAALRSE